MVETRGGAGRAGVRWEAELQGWVMFGEEVEGPVCPRCHSDAYASYRLIGEELCADWTTPSSGNSPAAKSMGSGTPQQSDLTVSSRLPLTRSATYLTNGFPPAQGVVAILCARVTVPHLPGSASGPAGCGCGGASLLTEERESLPPPLLPRGSTGTGGGRAYRRHLHQQRPTPRPRTIERSPLRLARRCDRHGDMPHAGEA